MNFDRIIALITLAAVTILIFITDDKVIIVVLVGVQALYLIILKLISIEDTIKKNK